MPRLHLAGVDLAYQVTGAGPPLTLLHGFTQRGAMWDEVIAGLPAGRRRITVDLRGHGDTVTEPGAACTMDACAGDLLQLWEHLDAPGGALVGYSMGGRLALHLAAHHPGTVSALAVVSAHAGLPDAERAARVEADRRLADRIEQMGVPAFVEEWEAMPLFAGIKRREPEFVASVHYQRLRNQAAGLACSLRGMGAGAMEPLWDRLESLRLPFLAVAGAEDQRYIALAERLAAAVPAGGIAVIEGSGHAVPQERPADLARNLAAFLDHLTS